MLSYLDHATKIHYQLTTHELIRQTLQKGEGVLSSSGALCISTGRFTGRSPQDKFIVRDAITEDKVDWNGLNQPMDEHSFLNLQGELLQYLGNKREVWVRDVYACADPRYRISIRIINEHASGNLFCYNMFLRPDITDLPSFEPQWHLIQAPGFKADPAVHATHSEHFVIISFTHQTILIGGTAYTGEIKKSVFSILNFILPQAHGVLSMHCSANVGAAGDVALFFGLSGTGKTTLSADSSRRLIGDDEHGWTNNTIFNFEGGCYAKIIDLCKEKEPAIAGAVKEGALVENVSFFPGTADVDFASKAITENTRASYPLHYITNALLPSVSGIPKHILFLTCDAYGVLPPVSRLTTEQAMYQFISGYTAKIAGTETGITEPKATFSACFGAPFLPLHPAVYTKLLGERLSIHKPKVWLVNTGWTGGTYGIGQRILLKDTRAVIHAILDGELDNVSYAVNNVFGLRMPLTCPGIDSQLLNPRNTWKDKDAYDKTASELALRFNNNFEQYADKVTAEIAHASPKVFA